MPQVQAIQSDGHIETYQYKSSYSRISAGFIGKTLYVWGNVDSSDIVDYV